MIEIELYVENNLVFGKSNWVEFKSSVGILLVLFNNVCMFVNECWLLNVLN